MFIIRLEAGPQSNIGFTFEHAPYARFYRFLRQTNFTKFEYNTLFGVAMNPFGNRIFKIFP